LQSESVSADRRGPVEHHGKPRLNRDRAANAGHPVGPLAEGRGRITFREIARSVHGFGEPIRGHTTGLEPTGRPIELAHLPIPLDFGQLAGRNSLLGDIAIPRNRRESLRLLVSGVRSSTAPLIAVDRWFATAGMKGRRQNFPPSGPPQATPSLRSTKRKPLSTKDLRLATGGLKKMLQKRGWRPLTTRGAVR
jgi:hypothetical protein